jgi:signal transduction histidine kinase
VGLKTKLLLIILSIAIIPPLTIAVQIGSQFALGSASPESLFIAIRLVSARMNGAVRSGDYSIFDRLPAKTGLTIVADDGAILFAKPDGKLTGGSSTSAGIKADAVAVSAALVAAAVAEGRNVHTFRFETSGLGGTAYLTVPSEFSFDMKNPVFILPIMLLSLLAIVSALSVFIVRSLGASIRKLEDATRRIATGDLDFPTAELARGDLASLGQSLDRMRAQLKEDRERRDRFIMGVSHDLKTPLAVIQGYLDALADGLADTEEKRGRYIGLMRSKASLLGERIAHLIQLAKTTSGEWRHGLAESDLGAFLEETLTPLAEYCAIRGYTVDRHTTLPEPCPVTFDRDMVARVLENLVENAVAYGDPTQPITIEACIEGATRAGTTVATASTVQPASAGAIVLTIGNGGPGIRPEDMRKIFEPFFRGDRGRNAGGFGLGLASVKSIVETHGWTITVKSEPGGRTEFSIRIPRG